MIKYIKFPVNFNNRHIIKKFLNIIGSLILCALIAFMVTFIAGWMMGYKLVVIDGGSMESFIHRGNIIVIREVFTKDELKRGDVVTFKKTLNSKKQVTHRIYAINGDQIITKGDPNETPDDGYITFENIVGKYVFQFQYLDEILNYLTDLSNLFTIIFGILVIVQMVNFYKVDDGRKWIECYNYLIKDLKFRDDAVNVK